MKQLEELICTAKIEAELVFYPGELKKRKNIEFDKEAIKKIGAKHEINIEFGEKTKYNIARAIVTVSSDDEAVVKNCLADIIKLYGEPDLPSLVFGSKKKGKELTKSVIDSCLKK